jgi:prepilin peptidase CpaA
VPNALTVPAFGAALVIAGIGGLPALGSALLGAAICFAFALPLFLVGGFGGGDVKLLTVFGAFLGPSRLPAALIAMALVGGGIAMVAMVRRRAVGRTFRNLSFLLLTFGRETFTGWKVEGSNAWITLKSPGAVTVPYAVAISAGALYAWFS